jgi:hypothetical protein
LFQLFPAHRRPEHEALCRTARPIPFHGVDSHRKLISDTSVANRRRSRNTELAIGWDAMMVEYKNPATAMKLIAAAANEAKLRTPEAFDLAVVGRGPWIVASVGSIFSTVRVEAATSDAILIALPARFSVADLKTKKKKTASVKDATKMNHLNACSRV